MKSIGEIKLINKDKDRVAERFGVPLNEWETTHDIIDRVNSSGLNKDDKLIKFFDDCLNEDVPVKSVIFTLARTLISTLEEVDSNF